MRRIVRFLRIMAADVLRSVADRIDPDLIVRHEYGGTTVERKP